MATVVGGPVGLGGMAGLSGSTAAAVLKADSSMSAAVKAAATEDATKIAALLSRQALLKAQTPPEITKQMENVPAAIRKATESKPQKSPPAASKQRRQIKPPPPPSAPPPGPPPGAEPPEQEVIVLNKGPLPQQQKHEPKWRSLKCRGAKLYAWACAAKLSGGSGGTGSSRRALEAATRMLEYLGLDDETLGSRLSKEALKELGAYDYPAGEDSAGALMSLLLQRNEDDDASSIASHLTTYRFQRALDVGDEYSSHGDDNDDLLGESSRGGFGGGVLSAASARAAAAYGLNDPDCDIPAAPREVEYVEEEPALKPERPPQRMVKLELFPKTKAVVILHDAISRGEERAVKNAVVLGAGSRNSREMGAFLTMARALHVAAARDGAFGAPGAGMVELLVSLGADVRAKDALGNTPFHVAAACGNASSLAALLRGPGGDEAAKQAAATRCHAGLTPLEVALARRRDARELFASILSRSRSFDVEFGHGSLGFTLALVRHNTPPPAPRRLRRRPVAQQPQIAKAGDSPPAATPRERRRRQPPPPPKSGPPGQSKSGPPGHRRHLSDGSPVLIPPPSPADPPKRHRRNRSADDADSFNEHSPRTLLVTNIAEDCDAFNELEPGDQLLSINGHVIACPDEAGFPALMAQLKGIPRPLQATFVAGSFPHLSVEEDPVVTLLERFSPAPKACYADHPVPAVKPADVDDDDTGIEDEDDF